MTGNKPVKKYRAGQITATIWEQQAKDKQGNEFTTHSIKVVKSYKDGDEWKETTSYNPSELVRVEAVTKKALEFVLVREEKLE